MVYRFSSRDAQKKPCPEKLRNKKKERGVAKGRGEEKREGRRKEGRKKLGREERMEQGRKKLVSMEYG